MKHLIACPEFRLAGAGGIGVYVGNIATQLAARGETVFIISASTPGAPTRETLADGRIVIHRITGEDAFAPAASRDGVSRPPYRRPGARNTEPQQWFTWQAALLAEELVEREHIDIVESQEYDAPLYVFQLRRALGLGPTRQPPVLVHLHSPTELIARHNDWPEGRDSIQRTVRLETQSVRLGDAFLAPSRHLASWAESRYGLAAPVTVIPYPLGDLVPVRRNEATWRDGTICFVGRLEGRKGIHEWLAAAAAVARRRPNVCFSFLGANATDFGWLTAGELLERHVPDELRSRFTFHGAVSREALLHHVATARIGVIPSRWDNFPNACIEMMASGLPVIVTPSGGMAEMVEDGASGWIAADSGPEALAAACERALAADAATLAAMGDRAAHCIRRLCDNTTVLDAQLQLRRTLVDRGAVRSARVSSIDPRTQRAPGRAQAPPEAPGSRRIGVVVYATGAGVDERTVQCIAAQTRAPSVIAVVPPEGRAALPAQWLRVGQGTAEPPARPLMRALQLLKESGVFAVAIVRPGDVPEPEFVERTAVTLETHPEIDVVSFWTIRVDHQVTIAPAPELPYQWLRDGTAAFSLIRASALSAPDAVRPDAPPGLEVWDAVNGILARGGQAVTLPMFLGEEGDTPRRSLGALTSRERAFILSRDRAAVSSAALELFLLAIDGTSADGDAHALSMRGRFAAARLLARQPVRTFRWIADVLRARYWRPLIPR